MEDVHVPMIGFCVSNERSLLTVMDVIFCDGDEERLRQMVLGSGRAGTCDESGHAGRGQQLATRNRAEAAMGETV